MFRKRILYVLLFFVSISCVDSSSSTVNYIIINETERTLELRFYDLNQLGESNLSFVETIDGPGLIFEKKLVTNDLLDTNLPSDVFKADSVAIIFDSTRIESHTFNVPFGNSIMKLSDYSRDGVNYTYTITQENYDNAVPCNGPCN